MEEIERLLELYGLNDKERKVYIACLQIGQDSAFNIAEKSGVKRATTYLILRSLIKKSLVTTHITTKSYLYAAASPENLVRDLEHRKNEVQNALPSLMALYNSQPDKPSIEIFEGVEGMKQIYEEILNYLKENQEVLFYGDLTHFVEHPVLLASWIKATKSAKGVIRELANGDAIHLKYKSDVEQNQNPHHEVKLLPAGTRSFLNDNAVFSDKLVIFSTQKHFFATVVKSKEIAASYRTIFNLAWANA